MAQRKAPKEKSELRKMRSVTITIEASEQNLQRLAALLLFATHLEPEYKYEPEGELPWEEPTPPKPPSDPIDYAVVRRTIVKQLEAYVAKFGVDEAKRLIHSFGAERLSLLPEDKLIPLYDTLNALLPAQLENPSA